MSTATEAPKDEAVNPLSMSDEDFQNQTEPSSEEVQEEPENPDNGAEAPFEGSEQEQQPADDKSDKSDESDESDPEDDGDKGNEPDPKEPEEEPKPKTPAEIAAENAAKAKEEKAEKAEKAGKDQKAEEPPKQEQKKEDTPPSGSKDKSDKSKEKSTQTDEKSDKEKSDKSDKSESDEKTPDLKTFHEQITAPFMANGKQIQVRDAAEAIQLMQMGANYTRKMQELAPHRKVLTMLGNHGLLDESKLSLYIALDKGDPEAVKKFIVDKGIDPLDIDTNTESTYQEGSYQVTDQEVAFRTQLDDVMSTDSGKEMLTDINKSWDQVSKDVLWHQPELMSIIQEQRESGIYTTITEEMDRRRTMGQLPANTPFLEAYKAIGDELHQQGVFTSEEAEDPSIKPEQGSDPAPSADPKPEKGAVVATRPASPRPSVDNGDKAGAAATTRSAPGKAKEATNFLSMSDDDFIAAAQLEGRV